MVELSSILNDAGILYVPKQIRDCFGRKVRILSDKTAALFYPEGVDYDELLWSLTTIRRDIIQAKRLELKRGNAGSEPQINPIGSVHQSSVNTKEESGR